MKMVGDKERGGGGVYERDLPGQMCSLSNACGKSVSLLKKIISKPLLKKMMSTYHLKRMTSVFLEKYIFNHKVKSSFIL